jgi:hypothetical protein
MYAERRASYRMALRDSLAHATDLSSGEIDPVRILSASGGAMVTAASVRPHDSSPRRLRFHLGRHAGFDAQVRMLGPAGDWDGHALVAFRFQSMTSDAMGALSAFLCREHARASNRLERLFSSRDTTLEVTGNLPGRDPSPCSAAWSLLRHHVVDDGGPLFVHSETSDVTVPLERTLFLSRRGGNVLLARVPQDIARSLNETEEYVFFCAGSLSVTWFRSRLVKRGLCHLMIPAPATLSQGGFRSSRRVRPPWNYPVSVVIDNPQLRGDAISRPIVEIAGNGFSIEFSPMRDRLFPGQHLPQVDIDLPTGTVEMACIVRMCRPIEGADTMLAGFEIVGFHSPQDHDRWMRAIVPCLFPRTRIGDQELVLDAWTRLDRSGYLELIEPSERERLRTPFFDDWTRQASHAGLHARFVLSYSDGVPIGITAANLVYPKTCLVHSGGIDKDAQGTGQVLDLYSAAFLFAHSMGEYCLSFFDAQKRVNSILFERFVRQYASPAEQVFDRFALFRWHAGKANGLRAGERSSRFEVVSANSRLTRLLWEHQHRSLSPLELDAYGASPDGHCMQQFSERCAANGYLRRRQLFFALRDGAPRAALVAETGSEGMNVFSLLNACTVVFMDCPAGERRDVLRSLLVRGIDYYGGAGKGAFLFLGFAGDERQAGLDNLGLDHVAEGWRWLTSRKVLPAYITYLRDLAVLRNSGQREGAEWPAMDNTPIAALAAVENRHTGGTRC